MSDSINKEVKQLIRINETMNERIKIWSKSTNQNQRNIGCRTGKHTACVRSGVEAPVEEAHYQKPCPIQSSKIGAP